MKKYLLGLCLVLALVGCGEKKEAPKDVEKPTIKIGAQLPLSGEYARIGAANQQAIIIMRLYLKMTKCQPRVRRWWQIS